MPMPQYPVTLVGKTQLSKNTLQLDFEFDGDSGKDFSFTAGQFVQFLIESGEKTHKRSYSIACSPESFQENGRLEIALSFVDDGLATRLFQEAEPGLKLQMTGAYGVLTLPKEFSGQLVLIGTGTGIAPYRSMLPQLADLADQGIEVRVLMGVRHRNNLIYKQDFTSVDSIDYRICLSREDNPDETQKEFKGYVQNQFSQLNLNPELDLVYLCGNPGMIDSAAAELKEMGFPPRQVKREKYVYSGH